MPGDPLRTFPDEFVPNVQASDTYKRWAKTSPKDKARWELFRDALLGGQTPAPPSMSTVFGKALVAAGKEHMSISSLVGQVTNPYPPGTPPPAPPPDQPSYYGLPLRAEGLANLQLGGTNTPGTELAIRFRAPTTSALTSVALFLKQGSGYSAGTGGTVLIELKHVDSSNFPTGSALASYTVSDPLNHQFGIFTFASPYTVTAGTLYCFHLTNTDGDPDVNFVSINNGDIPNPNTPRQTFITNQDYAISRRSTGNPSWSDHDNRAPIYVASFADGTTWGNPYIDYVYSSGAFNVGGTNRARSRFTVSGGDRRAGSVYVQTKKSGTPSSLVIEVKNAGGTVLGTATIAASAVDTSYNFVGGTLDTPVDMLNGQQYSLEVRASTGSYVIFPYDDGSTVSFPKGWRFTDGVHERSTNDGGSWSLYSSSTRWDMPIYTTPS